MAKISANRGSESAAHRRSRIGDRAPPRRRRQRRAKRFPECAITAAASRATPAIGIDAYSNHHAARSASVASCYAGLDLVCALRDPEVRSRLHAEWSDVLAGRDIAADDLPKLIYTRAVINETLRVYPPAWLQTRRVAQPFQIDGVPFRRGDILLLSPYVVGRDARYFAEPDHFAPERWIDEAWARALPKGAFFPFGGGPRGCPGRHLGMTELLVATVSIARRARLEIDPASRTSAWPGRTLIPNGLRLVVNRE